MEQSLLFFASYLTSLYTLSRLLKLLKGLLVDHGIELLLDLTERGVTEDHSGPATNFDRLDHSVNY